MNKWKLAFTEWVPEQQPLREALTTLGNGFFATRGALEEAAAGGVHYPGTYHASGYNRLESDVAGRIVVNEDMVNWPNWLPITFCPEGGEPFTIEAVQLLSFSLELDLLRGILERRMRFRDHDGRESSLLIRRFVSMAQPHLAAVQWTLIPENWSGCVVITSALDGTVINAGVSRYRDLNSRHLEPLGTGRLGEEAILLHVQTTQSRIRMAQGARHRLYLHDEPAQADRRTLEKTGYVAQELSVTVAQHYELRLEKIVALHTSRDNAISEEQMAVRRTLENAGTFEQLLETHARQWKQMWTRCDIELHDANESQLTLRLHIFHLLQTVSMNVVDLDAGVPARGLHGEAYRGHIFWDELFIFPFLNLRIPEITRSLLMYRFRRLDEARCEACCAGYRGAMYPWQSGSTGREESQVLHLNPKSGRWIPDSTRLQRHIGADIAYNIWQYYQATHDHEFLSFYGSVMYLEIARFWSSIAQFNPQRNRYEIHHVVGPDEYHTSYPDAPADGLRNNAYTNVMAAWALQHAQQVLNLLAPHRRADLLESLRLTDEEIARWTDISRRMFVPFLEEGILIEQFEGFGSLKEFDWEGYRRKYGNIHRLDRVLEAEDDTPNRYQAVKQADVLMLFYLFSADELRETFGHLGYTLAPDAISRNIDYYLQRTSHGSTLSGVVHSWVLSRLDRKRSWVYFSEALKSDLLDIQGGTTPEGIHLGAMAGTVDLVQRCFTGLAIRENALWLDPRLPEELGSVNLRIRYRGHWINIALSEKKLVIAFEEGWSEQVRIGFRDQIHLFSHGEQREFDL